MIVTLISGKL